MTPTTLTPVLARSSLTPTPFWRRLRWRLWSQRYLFNSTRESWRLSWICRCGDTARGLATVADIFLGGVSLMTSEEMKPGEVIDVELWNRPVEVPAVWQARVLSASPLPGGRWLLLACTFADRGVLALFEAA